MLDGIPAMTAEQIAAMTDEQRLAYRDLLAEYRRQGLQREFKRFARYVEVPGVPSPGDVDFSDIGRLIAEKRGIILPELKPDSIELYPMKLKPAAHHDLIMDSIQGMVEEDLLTPDGQPIDGLMIFCPPGAAKSTYSSMLAPAYLMGRWKNFNVIGGSFSQAVSNRFSRRAKAIVESPGYQSIFPDVKVVKADVENWECSNGSEYRSAGIMGGVTSFRANIFIVDDPVKNREEAESPVISEKIWEEYNDSVVTRLKPDGLGKLCLIMTRWSENDLAGRLLGPDWKGQSGYWPGTDGRNWYVINLPRVAEHRDDPLGRAEGELLWSDWFTWRETDRLIAAAAKGGVAARTWASLHQQRPAPTEGNILLRQYWQEWKKKDRDGKTLPPECTQIILSYDTAFEDGEDNDYSAMSAFGLFEHTSKRGPEEWNHTHAILLGGWRDKIQAADLLDVIEDQWKYFAKGMKQPPLILIEKRASGIQLIQELKRLRLPVKQWLPKGPKGGKGKIPRAHGAAMLLEQGSIHYVPGKITNQIIDECAAFPNSTNDDWVDTCTQVMLYMRDRYMFRTADEELDEEERKEWMRQNREKARTPRRLYGREIKEKTDDGPFTRLTEASKRRLYGTE